MGEKMGKKQFFIEIFVCKFENFLKNWKFFIDFLKYLKIFEFENRLTFLFLQCKKYPPNPPGTPLPIRQILYKLLITQIFLKYPNNM